ncbi:MAG: hypothetical protein GTN36_02975 [Candidatus Aenigmarchaeota archaeon]|nr:hypothetical protein [Candidatus Aenigmarchaeota archaeon]
MPLPDDDIIIRVIPRYKIQVSSKKELEQGMIEIAARNFHEVSLTIDALDANRGGLTPEQVSQLTKREEKRERKNLEKLYKADLVGKRGSKYTITDRNLEGIRRTFGPQAILLSAEFMTEKQKEKEYHIIND